MLKTINNKLNKKLTFMLAADPSAREDESFCLSVWTQECTLTYSSQKFVFTFASLIKMLLLAGGNTVDSQWPFQSNPEVSLTSNQSRP